MNEQMIDQLFEQFMYFSINKREELLKALVILVFLLFLIRKNRNKTMVIGKRKILIDESFNYLNEKLNYRGEYRIPEEIKKKLIKRSYDRASIVMLVADIMKHMGIPGKLPGVAVYNVSTCRDAEPGRCYMYGDGTSSITINLLPEYEIDIVAAIVIHECMHHYLNYKRMKFPDREKNEILTDICAVYSGFGNILYRGYRARAMQYKHENRINKLGYLNQNEIKYIMKKL